jgi:hypothetical protein
MRVLTMSAVALAVGLGGASGRAQVYQLPTPSPTVTASNSAWQVQGEPLFYAGTFYYPTGPTVFFDGNVMVRTGIYEGVPLYADSTLEPYSVVFVPIGRNVMRPYERRRTGVLAGTTGSRAPSFPIEHSGERDLAAFAGRPVPGSPEAEPDVLPEARPTATATAGVLPTQQPLPQAVNTPPLSDLGGRRAGQAPPIAARTTVASSGIWIPFDGARWFVVGDPVPYSSDQFIEIGTYHGLPVYRKRGESTREIYIPSLEADGPLARYSRR